MAGQVVFPFPPSPTVRAVRELQSRVASTAAVQRAANPGDARAVGVSLAEARWLQEPVRTAMTAPIVAPAGRG